MSALDTPHTVSVAIEKIEAFANGETAYATRATEYLFNHPRVGLEFLTPNGSLMRTTSIDGRFDHEAEEILILHARVIEAPQCPKYEGQTVKIAVFTNGTVEVLREESGS